VGGNPVELVDPNGEYGILMIVGAGMALGTAETFLYFYLSDRPFLARNDQEKIDAERLRKREVIWTAWVSKIRQRLAKDYGDDLQGQLRCLRDQEKNAKMTFNQELATRRTINEIRKEIAGYQSFIPWWAR
jgi:hypothetical protein